MFKVYLPQGNKKKLEQLNKRGRRKNERRNARIPGY